jgi:zinc/manganese transport system permease protein
MFGNFMMNAWVVATVVAAVAGAIGFFVVQRQAAFAAHALPMGAFTGAAFASWIGLAGLTGITGLALPAVFAGGGAVTIARLGRRGHRDVAAGLALVGLVGLGALFLSLSGQYEPETYSLLFGQVIGVASSSILPVLGVGLLILVVLALAGRPLLLSSVSPDLLGSAGGRPGATDLVFLLLMAVTTSAALFVVGALLTFSLMVAPPAAARLMTSRPGAALAGSVLVALLVVWAAIALAYITNWPVGFFVGGLGALAYGLARAVSRLGA